MSMVGVFVLFSAFVAITQRTLTSEALAQSQMPSSQMPSSHEPGAHSNHEPGQAFEPLLDGSVQPEDVPDDIAIRALMQTLRVPPNPDAAALKRLQARAGRVNLGEADFEILARELAVLDTRAKDQEARIEAVRTSLAGTVSGATARALEDQYREEQGNLNSLVEDHYQQLLQSLSPEGAEKLRQHLHHVKSRIKVFPAPDMSKQTL